MNVLTKSQIKTQYPDEWVLVGDPDLGEKDSVGTIIKQLVSGVVLYHSKDKREVAYKGRDARIGYGSVTLIYTGQILENRKFWI